MKIVYLTTEEIIQIHEDIIKETGGHSGVISYGNLDFIADQTNIPKTIDRISATLFYGILTSHPFVDGNKRTALESIKVFLALNSKRLLVTEDDLWDKLHDISEVKLKFEKIVNWIKKNTK